MPAPRGRTLVLALALPLATVGLTLTGCTPEAPGPTKYPERGCYEHLTAGETDVAYSGEPSELGNLEHWSSTDGSCTGRRVERSAADTTLMESPSKSSAEFLCRTLMGAPVRGPVDDVSGPWSPAFGPGAFLCGAV